VVSVISTSETGWKKYSDAACKINEAAIDRTAAKNKVKRMEIRRNGGQWNSDLVSIYITAK
jgi:hypothetical protein